MESKVISVYFDGKCSLCKKEIAYYKAIAPINTFLWRDIATEPKYLQEINVSQSIALRRLHVLDSKKKLTVGFDAFIIIWSNIKWWRFAALVASLPILNQALNICYNQFADWRYKRLPHCSLSSR